MARETLLCIPLARFVWSAGQWWHEGQTDLGDSLGCNFNAGHEGGDLLRALRKKKKRVSECMVRDEIKLFRAIVFNFQSVFSWESNMFFTGTHGYRESPPKSWMFF